MSDKSHSSTKRVQSFTAGQFKAVKETLAHLAEWTPENEGRTIRDLDLLSEMLDALQQRQKGKR